MYLGQHICSSVKFLTATWWVCIRAHFILVVFIDSKCNCVCYDLKLFFPAVSLYCSSKVSGFRKVCFPERPQYVLVLGMSLRRNQFFTVAPSKHQGMLTVPEENHGLYDIVNVNSLSQAHMSIPAAKSLMTLRGKPVKPYYNQCRTDCFIASHEFLKMGAVTGSSSCGWKHPFNESALST